jgi:hypothetical protein
MEIVMIRKWAANVASQGIALIASLLLRSAIKPLLEVDERSLLAVGLSRADLIECLSTPFTTDPTEFLVRRGRTRAGRRIRSDLRGQVRRRARPARLPGPTRQFFKQF